MSKGNMAKQNITKCNVKSSRLSKYFKEMIESLSSLKRFVKNVIFHICSNFYKKKRFKIYNYINDCKWILYKNELPLLLSLCIC